MQDKKIHREWEHMVKYVKDFFSSKMYFMGFCL